MKSKIKYSESLEILSLKILEKSEKNGGRLAILQNLYF